MIGFRDYAHMDSYYKISNQGGLNETEITEKREDSGRGKEQQQCNLHFQSTEEKVGEQEGRVEVICAWCGKSLGAWSAEASRQFPPGTVSHGICGDCRGKLTDTPNKNQGGAK